MKAGICLVWVWGWFDFFKIIWFEITFFQIHLRQCPWHSSLNTAFCLWRGYWVGEWFTKQIVNLCGMMTRFGFMFTVAEQNMIFYRMNWGTRWKVRNSSETTPALLTIVQYSAFANACPLQTEKLLFQLFIATLNKIWHDKYVRKIFRINPYMSVSLNSEKNTCFNYHEFGLGSDLLGVPQTW